MCYREAEAAVDLHNSVGAIWQSHFSKNSAGCPSNIEHTFQPRAMNPRVKERALAIDLPPYQAHSVSFSTD